MVVTAWIHAHAKARSVSVLVIGKHFLGLFFLFVVGLLPQLTPAQKSRLFWLTIIGVVLFSGSIYLLSTNTLTPIDFGFFGPITPIGGLFLISAWGVLFYHTLKNKF